MSEVPDSATFCEATKDSTCSVCPLRELSEETWQANLKQGYIDQPWELDQNLRAVLEALQEADTFEAVTYHLDRFHETGVTSIDDIIAEPYFEEVDGSLFLNHIDGIADEIRVPLRDLPPMSKALALCFIRAYEKGCVEAD